MDFLEWNNEQLDSSDKNNSRRKMTNDSYIYNSGQKSGKLA